MTLVSGQLLWLPYFLFLIFLIIKKEKKQSIFAILFLIIAVAIADWTSVHFFKNVFQRLRPCHNPALINTIRIVNKCGGQYGFISSHASNFFALASFSSLLIKKKYFSILAYTIAIIVIYSRIYLGVHYPSDVVAGAIWGFLTGFLIYKLYLLLLKQKK